MKIKVYTSKKLSFPPLFGQPQLHSFATVKSTKVLSTKLAVAIVVLPWLATQLADTGLVGLPLLLPPPISLTLSTLSRFQAVVRGTFGGGGTSGPCWSNSHC